MKSHLSNVGKAKLLTSRWKFLISLGLLPLLVACSESVPVEEADTEVISARSGDVVMVEYTGSLPDGSVFEQTDEGQARGIEIGGGEVLPAFEAALLGMRVGEEKTLQLPASQAFGAYRDDPGMRATLPRNSLSHSLELREGMRLNAAIFTDAEATESQIVPVTVVAINEDQVSVDANHPLAGKDLQFKLKVIAIQRP